MIDLFYSTASVAETADISNSVSTAIDEAALTDELLTRGNQKLKALASDMVKGIGTNRKKELKDDIDETDSLRDNLLITLVLFLKAFISWNKETISSTAANLLNIIRSHGMNITQQSLEKESALLDSILGEFAKRGNAASLVTLNLTTLVTELNEAQARFKLLTQQSATLESGKSQIIVPSSIRKDTINQLNTVINYLNMMYADNKSTYGNLTLKVAELVNNLNGKIRAHITVQKTATKKSTENGK
jgi:hypothetical protein